MRGGEIIGCGFFVSSKHLSRQLWIALSPINNLHCLQYCSRDCFGFYFRKQFIVNCGRGLLCWTSFKKHFFSELHITSRVMVYGITNQDVSRGVLGTASLRTIKQNRAWQEVPTEKLTKWHREDGHQTEEFMQAERKTKWNYIMVRCPLSNFWMKEIFSLQCESEMFILKWQEMCKTKTRII